MMGIYLGIIIFLIGAIITLVIDSDVKVPISGDFWDMPIRIKIRIFGMLFMIFGIFLVVVSVILM